MSPRSISPSSATGPIGVVELFFDGMVTKFSNLVRDDSLGGH